MFFRVSRSLATCFPASQARWDCFAYEMHSKWLFKWPLRYVHRWKFECSNWKVQVAAVRVNETNTSMLREKESERTSEKNRGCNSTDVASGKDILQLEAEWKFHSHNEKREEEEKNITVELVAMWEQMLFASLIFASLSLLAFSFVLSSIHGYKSKQQRQRVNTSALWWNRCTVLCFWCKMSDIKVNQTF